MAMDIRLADGQLTIELSGKDRFFAMRRSISVPLDSVVSAKIEARKPLVDQLAVRIRGSSIPGRVLAGSYSVWPHARVEKGDRQFWVTYWAPEVLVIDTSIPRPRRIVLETADQFRLVSEIEQQAALARSPGESRQSES